MSKNGLKIAPKKDKAQKTLEEAISAGKIREDAKKLRQRALLEKDEIMVCDMVLGIALNFRLSLNFANFDKSKIFGGKPVLQGEPLFPRDKFRVLVFLCKVKLDWRPGLCL